MHFGMANRGDWALLFAILPFYAESGVIIRKIKGGIYIPFIKIQNLTKKYKVGDGIISALNDVSLSVAEGEFLCVLGTSGSGKTTLLHTASGLERPTGGEVYIGGLSLTGIKESQMAAFRRKYMGFIFQSYNLVANLTSLENVARDAETLSTGVL